MSMSTPALSVMELADAAGAAREPEAIKPTGAPGAEPLGRRLGATGRGQVTALSDAALTEELRALAREHGVSVETVLTAAWALVMLRFTREREIAFGVAPATGVTLVGLSLDEDTSVSSLLVQVEQRLAERQSGHVELVPDVLVRIDGPLRAAEAPPGARAGAEAVLNLSVVVAGTLRVALDFERARFRRGMPERVARALLVTLGELVRGARFVRDVQAVPSDERELQLVTWNQTERPFPSELLLHEPFEARAKLQPEAVALETSTESFTYAELDAAANRLAHALRERGALPGVKLGIALPRKSSLVVALLAVVKTGAAYVPLDPSYPEERLARVLEDVAPVLVVTDSQLAQRFSACPTFLVDQTDVSALPATPLPRAAAPEDVCYVIYTSGSTGTPKGAVLQHRAVVNTCTWVNRTFAIGPGDRLLFVTSPSFDLSVYDTFGALGAGATVVLAEAQPGTEPEALAALVRAKNITIWDSAPAALEVITPFLGAPPASTTLRLVMLSGDFIPLRLIGTLRTAFPNARLVSLGGATEAAIWSNWFPIEELGADWVSVPYGKPFDNCRYYALDSRLEPVPIGAVGELYIGGACVALGYLNRPELTAEKFLADPFTDLPGSRLYRTGDLVRYFESGELEILGRADRQTKIRGYRIELGEIEAALRAVRGVEDAVCVVREVAGDKTIVAYVVMQPSEAVSESELKRELSGSLPAFMLPSRVVFIAELALSPNGKLDRTSLPPLDVPAEHAVVAPRTATERTMADIWRRLLGLASVGVTDNFFDVGGHSLIAVRLVNELRRAFSLEIPLPTVLEHPTIASLSAHIDALTSGRPALASDAAMPAASSARQYPPLHCIGGTGGNPFGIRRLAAVLGAEQPVFPLSPGGDPTGRAVADLAREVAAEVRRAQPAGPYFLAGFSAGGVLALEAAERLRREGEQVPLVILLDTFHPQLPKWSTLERVRLFAKMCRQAGLAYARARLLARLKFKLELASRRFGWARTPVNPEDPLEAQAALALVLQGYEPSRYEGDVLLLRTEPGTAMTDYRTDAWNGWRGALAGQFRVALLPGRHEDLLRENAPLTAEALRAALASARLGTFASYGTP